MEQAKKRPTVSERGERGRGERGGERKREINREEERERGRGGREWKGGRERVR